MKSINNYPLISINSILVLSILFAKSFSYNTYHYIYLTEIVSLISYLFIELRIKYRDSLKTYLILALFFLSFLNYSSISLKYHVRVENDSIFEIINTYGKNKSSLLIKSIETSSKYHLIISDSTDIEKGDLISIQKEFKRIKITQSKIPFSHSFDDYLLSKGVFERINTDSINLISKSQSLRISMRDKAEFAIDNSSYSDKSKSIVKALILGDKSEIDKSIINAFSDIGVMHLLALSGLHLGIISMMLNSILSFIIPQKLNYFKSITLIIILFIYTYGVNWPPSLLRASIMFSVIIINKNNKRKNNIFNSLSIASLIILMIDPQSLFDIGFQMSFITVLSIAIFNPILSRFFKSKNKVPSYFLSLISVSISAQFGATILSLYYFNKFSGGFLISNLILIPIFTLVLILAIVNLLISSLASWKILSCTIDFLIDFSTIIADKLSELDFLILKNITLGKYQLVAIGILFSVTYLFLEKRKLKINLILLSIVLLLVEEISILNDLNKREIIVDKGSFIFKNPLYPTSFYENEKYNSMGKYSDYLRIKKVKITDNTVIQRGENFFLFTSHLKANPIDAKNYIVISNPKKLNPFNVCNDSTLGIILLNANIYENRRFEYFTKRRKLEFFK